MSIGRDRLTEIVEEMGAHTKKMESGVEGVAKQLDLDPDYYQNWDLLFDGIGRSIHQLAASPWISVEDMLPERGQCVDGWHTEAECRQENLIYRGGEFCYAIFDDSDIFSHFEETGRGLVTHWMPIPDSPK